MAKKTKKAIKKLTKTVEQLREQNEELSERLTEALKGQTEATRALMQKLGSHPEESNGQEDEPEATDAAERKADELDVELTELEGTGSEGRILVKDVEDAAETDEDRD